MNELNEQILMNEEALGALRLRLETITADGVRTEADESKDNKEICSCIMDADLHRAISRLRDQHQTITYLLNFIQL
jgi:hypothetical protein